MCDETNMTEAGAERDRFKKPSKSVCVYDCRPDSSDALARTLDIANVDYNGFLQALKQEFSLSTNETFVISTTDRREIDEELYIFKNDFHVLIWICMCFDETEELVDGKTLHLLKSVNQELSVATQERIEYLPHYHTLVQCGMYEYYASEGQKALPYAFAELIDNALSATAKNTGIRRIEIRLLFDESQGGPAVVVMDNGCGMTSKQLNNWAVYRLSKFIRENDMFHSEKPGYERPSPVPRSLNSDISYFGVGGKQAVFYIGQSVRMISKPAGSPDVHEFVMSKEDFERKELNREDIYSGFIRNRKPGDCSHVNVIEEQFLRSIVIEEDAKESFTAVVITGIQPEHVVYLKQYFSLWTRELAHTYHYYIHGIDGNDKRKIRKTDHFSNIDIQISLFERSPRIPVVVNLRDVDNDMQTLYVSSSASTFEFKAIGARDSLVEGLIRYHPFLYDRETYPVDPYAASAGPLEDEDEDCVVLNSEGRGKQPIFECFWNGRLIPYTSVSEFEWCKRPKKPGAVPSECYNRISGVLFANDRFQVSTNKLTFMDLELQLRDKETIFTRVHNGQEQRVKIEREFTNWLKECHERFDKQVMFQGFQGVMTREDVPKRLQSPWAKFQAIKWDGKTYKKGQFVKSVKTQPILFGSVVQFLLYGDHEDDVYATGGHVQIALEPKDLYDEQRIIPIFKIDRQATAKAIKEHIDNELAKLPEQLKVMWPKGNDWAENDARPAGTPLGPIKVDILNKNGETKSRLPVAGNSKKLSVDLKIIWHSPKGDVPINSFIGVHSAKWEYWFKAMEGEAVSFMLDIISSPVHVGVPFNIPLNFRDEFEYPTQPPCDIKLQLECSSLKLSYEGIAFGTTSVIRNVRVMGKISHQSKLLGAPDLPVDVVDCSNTGSGLMLTKPLLLKTVNPEQVLTAKFNIPNNRTVACVERQLRILPSSRISRLEVYRQEEGSDDVMVIQNSERIDWTVNWTAELNANELSRGKLPHLCVPSQAQREYFCNVSFHDRHTVNMSFIIVPRPDEPERLRVNLSESTVKMGEILSGNTYVEVIDQYGNKTDCLNAESVKTLSVSANDLDKEALAIEWKASIGRLSVSGVRFKAGSIGPRELCFKYQDMKEFVRIEVTAGPPAKIILLEKPEIPFQVINGHGLDTPLVMQLCDEWGNPSPDQRVEIGMKNLSSLIKVKSSVMSQPVDSEGKACFILERITGAKGEHHLEFLGSFSRNGIPGPIISLNVIPDPNKPVKLCIEYDSAATLCAGDVFPVFTVVVLSEEGGPIALNVVPNKAVKLAPETPPSTPVVSNSNIRANRTLLDSLNLKIMDQYDNAAGEGIDGKVVVTVEGPGDIVVPLFENGDKSLSYSLINGETPITDLVLLENSPGVDGAEYILQFHPEIQQTSVTIAPYSLPFRFCNDAEYQKFVATLSKKKDSLSRTILMYKEFFETNEELKSELQRQVQDATHKQNELKPELMKSGLDISKLTTVAHLAQVEDDDAAKVISWHILGDMDCVVTETTSAAKKIYDDTQGRQQVIPLETVFWRPNDRCYIGSMAVSNELCVFFATLLGDTILIDDLDSANDYRRQVVQNKMQCPTLLTRQGERIRSNGKFGGLQNKAPSIEKLRGQVFGAPLPKEYHHTCHQIGLLQQYCVAMKKASDVRSEYNSHVENLQSPQMKQKQQEHNQQREELKELEKTLARTPEKMSYAARVKRSLEPETPEPSVPPKRIRRKSYKLGKSIVI
ncbi:Structural maintenance of chromosomes flexible hinge domain-containing protein 1 [Anabarilius grahami]|uniref:Structural maintenance of chromosomes flexible hinge domain-containing protein 1 n=1 Tax=Anabarilius grahami TaxID=495550 RepID=A0A3N0Y7W1_ANAGA|nr:Structural maintenance of chromosomes flexible hinge domain-containing protein 1 [Anabarilius grahami]